MYFLRISVVVVVVCLCRKQNHNQVTAIVPDFSGDAGGERWSAASLSAGVGLTSVLLNTVG